MVWGTNLNKTLSSVERQQVICTFGSAGQKLSAALEGFPRTMWQFRPASGEWSIHDIIIHLADAEAQIYCRLRWGIAQPGAPIAAYDQSAWAAALYYPEQSCEDALVLFKTLRQMSFRLINMLPPEMWTHTVEHPENGTLTMDDLLVFYTDHIGIHIRQMEECYQAWNSQQAASSG